MLAFVHLLKYLLSAYRIPSTVLNARDVAAPKLKYPFFGS